MRTKTKITLLFSALLFTSSTMASINGAIDDEIVHAVLAKKIKNTHSTRPRSLTPESIEICYDNGILSFSASGPVGEMTVSVINIENGDYQTFYAVNINDCIMIDLTSGIYSIVCDVDNDTSYEGLLYL